MAKQINKNYSLILADANTLIEGISTADITVTIPLAKTVPFKLGDVVTFTQNGSGAIIFKGATGVVIDSFSGTKTAGKNAIISLLNKNTNIWHITGNLK